ncbi:hypothetical protein AABB24_009046 [Solanum stoloniferum]|uniref:Uncharacterized protein n=1 Tax=Solanum stoloniferum TaxID=62892 RepID=A0ABD2UK75_9SOLN
MTLAYSFFCFLLMLVQAKGRNDSTCPKFFSCGNLTDLSFPFSLSSQSDCGLMTMSGCDTKPYPRIQLLPGGDWYNPMEKPHNFTVWLLDLKLHTMLRQRKCQIFSKNFSLHDSPSVSFTTPTLHDFKNVTAPVVMPQTLPRRRMIILLVIKCTMLVKTLAYTTSFLEMMMKTFEQAIFLRIVHLSDCQLTR